MRIWKPVLSESAVRRIARKEFRRAEMERDTLGRLDSHNISREALDRAEERGREQTHVGAVAAVDGADKQRSDMLGPQVDLTVRVRP